MKRINKKGEKIKLDITFIHNKNGIKLDKILKEGYLNDLKNMKTK